MYLFDLYNLYRVDHIYIYIEIYSIEIDAILNNSSAVVMATKDNVTDEQVTECINKVISNNESLLNLIYIYK